MAGIGAFGRAMIPIGSAAGYQLNSQNALYDRNLRNQLLQQEMQLRQRQGDMMQRQLQMQEGITQFNMGQELYNQKQQKAINQATAQEYSQMSAMAKTPDERVFWDRAANIAAAGGGSPEIMKMANAMGYGDEAKQFMEAMHAHLYETQANENSAWTNMVNRLNPGSGAVPSGGMMPPSSGTMPGGMGAIGTRPSVGGSLGAMGSPLGRTSRTDLYGTMQMKGGKRYYIDGSGNYYEVPSGPLSGGSDFFGGGADSGAP